MSADSLVLVVPLGLLGFVGIASLAKLHALDLVSINTDSHRSLIITIKPYTQHSGSGLVLLAVFSLILKAFIEHVGCGLWSYTAV